ncbi:MAG: NAD(P)-binding protein [Chloroflexota bacterium]|nr:NAD(P)-binding protein [Chloroflexota bacterium]
MQEQHYDAIIIGAGLGGLLSAAQLLQRGKRVVVLERLPHCGGRFTAKTFHGVQVSTGAVHMLPFGSSGVLARMLRRLQVPHRLFDADVFGSFHVHGKQIRARGLLGAFKFLGPRQFFWFARMGYLMFLRPLPARERDLPFSTWLDRHLDVKRNRELATFFACISRFALSLELDQVSTAEVIETCLNMFSYGAPGIVEGGCGTLSGELERHILAQGADLRLRQDVMQILHEDEQITGVRGRDKASGAEVCFYAPLVVSDIGPRATDALLENRQITQAAVLKQQQGRSAVTFADLDEVSGDQDTHNIIPEAVGLKVHLLSDISLIPHKGIMYCLDTQRIAGMVQPTNCDPSLAPPGKHLLISHQVIQSNNIEEEKALALADLRLLFGGDAFEQHCHILTMSTYRGEWPVNRIAQGADVSPSTRLHGLYLVGDAVKPSGYLMVEGVAQSVNHFLDLLTSSEQGPADTAPEAPHPHKRDRGKLPRWKREKQAARYVIPPPSRLNALRWLWQAPGNSGKS